MTQPLSWQVREPPLPAAAALASGPQVPQLAADTVRRLDAGAWLRACAAPGWLVVLGDTADLPWADGARYLGWESGVLVPTTLACLPGAAYVRAATDAASDELVVLLPDAVLTAPQPRRRADPAALR